MTTFIHERMKLYFVHVPKTGGMTVTGFFSRGNNRNWRDDFSLLNRDIGIHDGVEKIHAALGEEINDYFSFAFYRNTWDWFFSLYRYIYRTPSHPMHSKVKSMSFDQFCLEEAESFYRPQKPLVTLNGNQAVTRLINFSNFSESFESILKSLGYRDIEIEAKNRAGTTVDYRRQYSKEMRDHLGKVYADDIDYFGFDF